MQFLVLSGRKSSFNSTIKRTTSSGGGMAHLDKFFIIGCVGGGGGGGGEGGKVDTRNREWRYHKKYGSKVTGEMSSESDKSNI